MLIIRFADFFCGSGGFRLGLETCNGQQQKDTEIGGCGNRVGDKGQQPNQSEKRGNYISGVSQSSEGESPERGDGSSNIKGICLHSGLNPSFTCVWANDNDKYACQIYRRHWNDGTLHEGDIRTTDVDTIPDFDLLCAGFPCQSFSIAGARGGFADIRGTLFQEICRVAGAKRTPYLLLENVKGLLSVPYTEELEEWDEEDFDEAGEPTARAQKRHKGISGTKGWVFLTILDSLWELGYDCQWQVLNSKDFGVPQNRERVFVVGHLRGEPRPKVFPIGETNRIFNQEKQEIWMGAISGRQMRLRNKELVYEGAIMSEQNQKWLDDGKQLSRNFPQGQRVYSTEGIASSICGDAGGLGGKTGLYEVKPVLTPDRERKRQHGRRMKENGEPMFTLTGQDIHGVEITVPTIRAEHHNTADVHYLPGIRRLTPLECERLQGFPDGWTEGISDTQRYKCLGNAVTVTVIEAIGQQFVMELA